MGPGRRVTDVIDGPGPDAAHRAFDERVGHRVGRERRPADQQEQVLTDS